MVLVFILSLLLLIAGVIEKSAHLSRVRKIPIRIHVNGTRGKSLLTRLLTTLFTEEELRTASKVTGETPAVFYPSRGWQPWYRLGVPRIREQIHFMKKAEKQGVEAIVVENMAISPEIMGIAENEIVQSGLSVFTNFRADHQETMGKSMEDIVHAMSHALPRNGCVILPASELSHEFVNKTRERNNDLVLSEVKSPKGMGGIGVFDDIFGLARLVGQRCGLSKESIQATLETVGRHDLEDMLFPLPGIPGRSFVNLFSCNDVHSSKRLIAAFEDKGLIQSPYGIVLASREDRPLRTMAFLKWIVDGLSWSHLIIAGAVPRIPIWGMLRHSDHASHSVQLQCRIKPSRIIGDVTGWDCDVLGLGNFVHTGENILSEIRGARIGN